VPVGGLLAKFMHSVIFPAAGRSDPEGDDGFIGPATNSANTRAASSLVAAFWFPPVRCAFSAGSIAKLRPRDSYCPMLICAKPISFMHE
jgi:hypothetical protein